MKIFFLFLVLLQGSQGFPNIADFQNLSNDRLLEEKARAIKRITIFSDYNTVLYGAPPDPNPAAADLALRTFSTMGHEWNKMTQLVENPSVNCVRFFKNTRMLIEDILKSFSSLNKYRTGSFEAVTLRARIEVDDGLLSNEMNLLKKRIEGGEDSVTDKGHLCFAIDRENWESLGDDISNSSNYLIESTWGERGLYDAFPVSSQLLIAMNHREKMDERWRDASYVGAALLAFPILRAASRLGRVLPTILSRKMISILKGFTLVGFATLGGYVTKEYAKEYFRVKPRIADPWNGLQYFVEDILTLNADNLEAYYYLLAGTENSILAENQIKLQGMLSQIALAKAHFGSTEAAKKLAETKLKEIDFVLAQRASNLRK
jgi:hypothetical protein